MDRINVTDLSLVNAKTEVSACRTFLNKADYYHMGIIPLFFPGYALGRLFRSYTRQGSESRLVGRSGPAYVAVLSFQHESGVMQSYIKETKSGGRQGA